MSSLKKCVCSCVHTHVHLENHLECTSSVNSDFLPVVWLLLAFSLYESMLAVFFSPHHVLIIRKSNIYYENNGGLITLNCTLSITYTIIYYNNNPAGAWLWKKNQQQCFSKSLWLSYFFSSRSAGREFYLYLNLACII